MVSSTIRLASSSLLRSVARSSTVAMLPRVPTSTRLVAPALTLSAFRLSPAVSVGNAVRGYASGSALSHQEIQNRIIDVLKSFEKVDPAKVNIDASFTGTLGLDSLDAVEVVMAIEEEFNIEIPDADADAIHTVGQAIEYISKTPEAQ